jgi:hypothetical protein
VSDIAAFIEARLIEDEAAANPTCCGCFDANHVPPCTPRPWLARPRREVEAKRAILRRYEVQAAKTGDNAMEEDRAWALWPVIAHIAAVWADHEDYDESWRP